MYWEYVFPSISLFSQCVHLPLSLHVTIHALPHPSQLPHIMPTSGNQDYWTHVCLCVLRPRSSSCSMPDQRLLLSRFSFLVLISIPQTCFWTLGPRLSSHPSLVPLLHLILVFWPTLWILVSCLLPHPLTIPSLLLSLGHRPLFTLLDHEIRLLFGFVSYTLPAFTWTLSPLWTSILNTLWNLRKMMTSSPLDVVDLVTSRLGFPPVKPNLINYLNFLVVLLSLWPHSATPMLSWSTCLSLKPRGATVLRGGGYHKSADELKKL